MTPAAARAAAADVLRATKNSGLARRTSNSGCEIARATRPSRIPPRSHVIGCRRQNRVDAPTSAVAHGRAGSADAAIAGTEEQDDCHPEDRWG